MGLSEIKNRALRLIAEKAIVKETVSDDEADKRFSVCLKCEKRNAEENTCTVCGCFLDLKTGSKVNLNAKKLRNEITHCPLGRWNDKEIANVYREMDGKELLT